MKAIQAKVKNMNRIVAAVKMAAKSRMAVASALVSFAVFLPLFVYSTIVTTPGNSLELWNQFTPDAAKALVLVSAAALGILFGLLVYSFKQKASFKKAGIGAAAAGSGFFAALIGTAACLSCLAALLGFLGVGTLIALLDYQLPIMVAGLLITLASIYVVSGSIVADCTDCKPGVRK